MSQRTSSAPIGDGRTRACAAPGPARQDNACGTRGHRCADPPHPAARVPPGCSGRQACCAARYRDEFGLTTGPPSLRALAEPLGPGLGTEAGTSTPCERMHSDQASCLFWVAGPPTGDEPPGPADEPPGPADEPPGPADEP